MINIPEIYNDPILFRNRRGDEFSPYVSMKESVVINKGRAILSEQPNKFDKVKVTGLGRDFHETIDGTLDENTYRVSYLEGAVYFHGSLEGRTLTFEYTGQGVFLYPDSRIYLTDEDEFPTIRDKFKDVDRAILVERQRINEHIISHPQPSEVVDMRVDYNGKVFPVAKERIDAEQKKIEEAYVDAFGKRHSSLKKRIDSMQLAVEESIDDIEDEQIRLDSQIKIIPGQINLKVSELRKEVDGELALMQSEINMLPELISLEVSELREEIDGQITNTRSMISILAGEIELKVDHNGIVSSINLSKEGVRISGKKLWLDGETRIDNAVIKSAHIDSITADKITAGVIDADKISVHGGSSREYISIQGNKLESQGRYTTTWFGETITRDVRFEMQNGYLRVRNMDDGNRNLYFSDRGIHTFQRGYEDESDNYEYHGSGIIEFFSHQYHDRARGLTLFSNRGIVAMKTMTRDIVLDAARDVKISADRGVVEITGGLRSSSIGVIDTNTNFYIGVDNELRVTNKNFYNSGNTRYMDVRSRYYFGRALRDTGRSSFIYLGSDLGVRVTSRGINQISSIIYRPIQASSFQTRSSRDSKENIVPTKENGLKVINDLNVIDFNYIGSTEKRIGFVAEESPKITNEDKDFVDLSSLTTYLALAVQELTKEVNELREQVQS